MAAREGNSMAAAIPPGARLRGPAPVARGGGDAAEAGERRVDLLGVPVTLCPFDSAVERVREMITSGASHYLVLANAHTLNVAYESPDYLDVLRRADLVLRDGVGMEIAARWRGIDAQHNFVGTDFVPDLLRALRPTPVRVFLFGAEPGIAERAACALERQAPNVRIVGTAPGFGAFARVMEQVRAAKPDVLLVALGNPLQELWISRHYDRLGVPLAIGVGALFDFLGGRVTRAPKWVLRLRGEWLFRLLAEPRRLWRRYVTGGPKFLWRVAMHGRKGRA
jgi:exopolysaccharide biosynthesis WecB/TagA/CpsF family protein